MLILSLIITDGKFELPTDYLISHDITDRFVSVTNAMTCAFTLLRANFRQ